MDTPEAQRPLEGRLWLPAVQTCIPGGDRSKRRGGQNGWTAATKKCSTEQASGGRLTVPLERTSCRRAPLDSQTGLTLRLVCTPLIAALFATASVAATRGPCWRAGVAGRGWGRLPAAKERKVGHGTLVVAGRPSWLIGRGASGGMVECDGSVARQKNTKSAGTRRSFLA